MSGLMDWLEMSGEEQQRMLADPSIVQHAKWRNPATMITAPEPSLHTYDIVSERNRQDYVRQSAATVGGVVAPFTQE